MIKISVIIPAYNGEKFLESAVRSIDYINDELEIIIVNDGSTDNTLRVAKRLESEISQLKVIDQQNTGLAQSRNNAVNVAYGQYLMFLDVDDRYKNNAVSRVINIINKEEPDLIIYNVEDFDIISQQVTKVTRHTKQIKRAGSVYWNKVYRKTLFDDISAPVGHLFEDSAVIPFVVAKADDIILVNEVLYSYSVNRSDSIMAKNFGSNFSETVFAIEYLRDLNRKSDLTETKKNQVDDYIIAKIMFIFRNKHNLETIKADDLCDLIRIAKQTINILGIRFIGIVKYMLYLLLLKRAKNYAKRAK